VGALLLALLYLATAAALAAAPPAVGRRRASPWVAAALGLIPLAFTASGFLPGRALTPTPLLAGVPPWADPARVAAIDAGSSGANPLLLDPVSQMIPWRRAARDGLLFDPGQGGGAALLGNGQSAALYPTEVAARALSPFRAVTYSQAARLLVAVWGMFWLARALALAELPALLAAAVFAGSGFLQLWRLHPHSLTAATVPWIALAALVAVRRPGPGAAVALVAAGAVGLAAGHPETLLHGVLFALLVAVPVAVAGRRRPRGGLGRGAATGAVAAVLAFLLAAPLLLPVVTRAGVDPIQFSAIIATNLGMGLITPPTAPILYFAALIGKANLATMLKPSLVFVLFAYLPVVLLTTFVPGLAMWLPRLILGL
jgi:hypothetical protein